MLNFDKLNDGPSRKQIDPRRIFTTLKTSAKFKRPLDEQADILDEWFQRRDSKDLIIKMNTGGGKTLVGLLCLQSSLNENIFPAVYITPDKYLTSQVMQEANELGIKVTDDVESQEFLTGKSILVTNIYKVVNGKSVFGVLETKIKLGSIIIDDAHACLNVVKEQFTISINSDNAIYKEIKDIFQKSLKRQSHAQYLDIEEGLTSPVLTVPYWEWQSNNEKITEILHLHKDSDAIKFGWPLVKDCLHLSTCIFSGNKLEITPNNIPIEIIPSFAYAKRRIYMTATLADDTILVSHFKANVPDIEKPIRPKGGGDIGTRMVLIPQEINPYLKQEDLKELALNISEEHNVIVIVPSNYHAKFWESDADLVIGKDNIYNDINTLKNTHVGLTVLINRYDGIDLPNNACRLLIIDELPEFHTLSERVEMSMLDGTHSQLSKQIQRIEQGIGRGVRSSDDYCAVLLLGSRLVQRLHQPEARKMFSATTRVHINLGEKIAEQAKNSDISELEKIIGYCLNKDDGWMTAERDAIVEAEPIIDSNLNTTHVYLRQAFDSALIGQYDEAILSVQKAVNETNEEKEKGFLKQILASYTNFIDPAEAQVLQLSALKLNQRLLKPIEGVKYNKLSNPVTSQTSKSSAFLKQFSKKNDFLIWKNELLTDLQWGEEGSTRFEAAIMRLGQLLGFSSNRPEDEYGNGPDNLWALGNMQYLVIECKSGATRCARISKHDINQLNGSITWFENRYRDDLDVAMTPIMIHPKTIYENAASPNKKIRIIEGEKLDELHKSIEGFSKAMIQANDLSDEVVIGKQLNAFNLSTDKFVAAFTIQIKLK